MSTRSGEASSASENIVSWSAHTSFLAIVAVALLVHAEHVAELRALEVVVVVGSCRTRSRAAAPWPRPSPCRCASALKCFRIVYTTSRELSTAVPFTESYKELPAEKFQSVVYMSSNASL